MFLIIHMFLMFYFLILTALTIDSSSTNQDIQEYYLKNNCDR